MKIELVVEEEDVERSEVEEEVEEGRSSTKHWLSATNATS
jgi:hypothetical protein